MRRGNGTNRSRAVAHFATRIVIALGPLVALVAREARGSEGSRAEAVRIDYQASEARAGECPSEEAFVASLRARVAYSRAAATGDPARAFVVRIRPKSGRYAGELAVRETDGTESHRHVEGDTCDDVAAALALVAGLAIDPAASSTASAPATAPPPAPAPSGPTAPMTEVTEPARVDAIPAAPPPEAPARFRPSLGFEMAINGGITPPTLLGFRAFADVTRERGARFSWSMRIAVERAATGDVDVQGGGARFAWTTVTLDFCPVREARGFLRVTPCARLEAGGLDAEGTRVTPPRSDLRTWIAIDALLRIDAILPGPFFIGGAFGLRAPVLRDRFFFEPDVTIYRPPPVGWLANVGGGVTFP